MPPEMERSSHGSEDRADEPNVKGDRTGPWLFGGALIAVMAFFWWLTIFPHGVAPHVT